MKVALIGLGDIATKAYLPIFSKLKDVEFVLCSRDHQKLRQLGAQYRIKNIYTDYKELLKASIDAVMIHSATSSHFEIASFFLKHKIPTFVDKPLADNYSHVEMLYEIAQKNNVPLYVGFNRRHIPLYNEFIPHLQKGDLSGIHSFRWEKNRYQLPGFLKTFVFDDFIHPLDSINVCAKASIEDANIFFQTKENQLARLDIQWQCNQSIIQASMNRQFGTTVERVQVCLENETYEFNSFISGIKIANDQETKIALKDWTPMLESKGFYAMLNDWFEVVGNGQLPMRQVKRNLSSHYLAEQIYQKLKSELPE